jgi:hypothetical protein
MQQNFLLKFFLTDIAIVSYCCDMVYTSSANRTSDLNLLAFFLRQHHLYCIINFLLGKKHEKK